MREILILDASEKILLMVRQFICRITEWESFWFRKGFTEDDTFSYWRGGCSFGILSAVVDCPSRTLLYLTCNFAHIGLKHRVGNDCKAIIATSICIWSYWDEEGGSISSKLVVDLEIGWWVYFTYQLLCGLIIGQEILHRAMDVELLEGYWTGICFCGIMKHRRMSDDTEFLAWWMSNPSNECSFLSLIRANIEYHNLNLCRLLLLFHDSSLTNNYNFLTYFVHKLSADE